MLADVHGALDRMEGAREYAVLNTGRVLAFVHDRQVISKVEGGRWGLDRLPTATGRRAGSRRRLYPGTAALSSDEDLRTLADRARGALPAVSD